MDFGTGFIPRNLRSCLLFAELVILRLFEAAGWRGVWVDTYRKCFGKDCPDSVGREEIPEDKLAVLEGIYKVAANSGCFDIFVWMRMP